MATYFKGEDFRTKVYTQQWYVKDFTVDGPARDLFEKYCGLAPDRVVEHVGDLRDRAWENMPYAYIGSLRFLNFSLSQHPFYTTVLARLTSPNSSQTLLDLGCCFGQDIRKLVHDGAPSSRLYGIDIDAAFLDLGYDLFLDRNTLESTFITADLFSSPSTTLLSTLGGGVDMVYAAAFFHLFNWDQQVDLAQNVVKLMKPTKGSVLLGRQLGSASPGEYPHLKRDGTTTYWHDVASWEKLWKEVSQATGTAWTVEAGIDEEEYAYKNNSRGDPSMRRLVFIVTRG